MFESSPSGEKSVRKGVKLKFRRDGWGLWELRIKISLSEGGTKLCETCFEMCRGKSHQDWGYRKQICRTGSKRSIYLSGDSHQLLKTWKSAETRQIPYNSRLNEGIQAEQYASRPFDGNLRRGPSGISQSNLNKYLANKPRKTFLSTERREMIVDIKPPWRLIERARKSIKISDRETKNAIPLNLDHRPRMCLLKKGD